MGILHLTHSSLVYGYSSRSGKGEEALSGSVGNCPVSQL